MTKSPFVLTSLLAIAALLMPTSLNAEEALYVSVKRAKVKAEPFYLSKDLASLKIGDKVLALGQEQNGWVPVQIRATPGYIASSSVVSDPEDLVEAEIKEKLRQEQSISSNASAVELAAKGIEKSSAFEMAYLRENPDLLINAVNDLERTVTSDQEIVNFRVQGKLQGGAK